MKANLNGISVNFEVAGKGKPLLFIHAFPLGLEMWRKQIEHFSHAHQVIAYDVRGFGESGLEKDEASIDQYVDDLFALMDYLNLPSVTACGLSMGGYILLRALERNIERFDAVILADTKSEADSEEGKQKRLNTVKKIKVDGLNEFSTNFLKDALGADATPQLKELVQSVILKNPVSSVAAALIAMAGRTDTSPVLKKIQVPTLVLVGEQDKLTPPAVAQSMAQQIKEANVITIPHAGHLSQWEQSEIFNAHLSEFLKTNRWTSKNQANE